MRIMWKRVEPTIVQKQGHRTIVTKTFQLPDGRTEQFDIKEREGWAGVAVVALTKTEKVLVFRQFRPGVEMVLDELPGGLVEEDEADIRAAALRELAEETGYAPGHLTYLGKQTYDSYTNGWRHYFLAEDCEPSGKGQALDPNERGGQLQIISISQLINNALSGRMTDPGGVLLACAAKRWQLPQIYNETQEKL